ncbi:hypothetical protein DSECCO2_284920 [anaerobic digester metagenome]
MLRSLILLILVFAAPVSAGTLLFEPASDTCTSDRVLDAVNGPGGSVVFATDNGISYYSGDGWQRFHAHPSNASLGLLSDMVLAVEYDARGDFWIGYGRGLQRFDGHYFEIFSDVALLKDPVIRDLQRWGDDLFVATGSSGVHRFRDGTWTWFRPFGSSGLGCHSVASLAVDARFDRLVVGSMDGGLWEVVDHVDPIRFSPVEKTGSRYSLLTGVRPDPLGGCYAFNESLIVHHDPDRGFREVVRANRIRPTITRFNDCCAATDGTLWCATDGGLVGWRDGELVALLERKDGLGVSSNVRMVFLDETGRCWFTTPGFIGVYSGTQQEIDTRIGFMPPETASPTITVSVTKEQPWSPTATLPVVVRTTAVPPTPKDPLTALKEVLVEGIRTALSRAERIARNIRGDPQHLDRIRVRTG